MAIFPERLKQTTDPAALARYIRYMTDRLERQNALLTKRISELEKAAGAGKGGNT